jgi:hypothetical protein
MPKKSPYDPSVITKAVELYQSGLSSEQVSQQLGVPTRTVARWVKVHGSSRGAPIEPDSFNLGENYAMALRARVASHAEAVAWVENLEATQSKLGSIHADLIDDLHSLLNQAINCSDPSPRAINTLSLCLDRHMTAALRVSLMGRDRQIDCISAFSVLESWGYVVFDSARLQSLFGVQENPFSPPNEDDDTNTYE